MDRLGPDIFSTLQIKGHVLHRGREHLKVTFLSLVDVDVDVDVDSLMFMSCCARFYRLLLQKELPFFG